jgi:hypothetical protein
MKLSPLYPSRHQMAVLAAAFGLALLAAPAAHAFTMEGVSNSDGSAKFSDPADQVSRFGNSGSDSGTAYRQGNTSFQFGPMQQASPDARFNSDAARMFNPLGRPGEPGR